MSIDITVNRINMLIGCLQDLAAMDDERVIAYIEGVGLKSIIEQAAGYRTPYVLVVDDRHIHASGPQLLDELFDELALENRLKAASDVRSRFAELYSNLSSFDLMAEAQFLESSKPDPSLVDVVGEGLDETFRQLQQTALELSLFMQKLRKVILDPERDPIEEELTGRQFAIYRILKHRRSIWTEYADLAERFGVQEGSVKRYLRAMETSLLKHGKCLESQRGQNKCRLASISDETIR